MENISLKQWIIAGIKSGIVIGILLFFILYLLFAYPVYTYESFTGMFPFLFGFSFISNVFFGLIIGLVLSRAKLGLKSRFLTCMIVSIITVAIIVFPAAIFLGFVSAIHMSMWMFFSKIFGPDSFLTYLPTFLIGTAFGFLINFFISKGNK